MQLKKKEETALFSFGGKMFTTIIKEFKELISNKKIWIGILTVLIIIIIGTSYNKQNSESKPADLLKLGVINHDDSTYSNLLLSYFNSSETFSSLINVTMGEEDEVKEAFENGKLDIYLEIPKDFAMNMMRLKHSPINVTLNITDTTKAILFQNVLRSYEKYITAVEANAVGLYDIMEQEGMEEEIILDTNRKISIDLILTALGKETFFSFQPMEQFPSTSLMNYYISSFLVLTLLYGGLYIGFQVLREMKQGTFTRLRTTPMPLYQFLTAKMLLLVMILSVAVATAMSVLTGELITGEGALFSVALAMFSVCMSVFLCSLFNTTQRFVLAGNLLIFCFIIVGGGIIPIQFLPQSMVLISKFTPNYYMMRGIMNYCQGQNSANNRLMILFILISAVMLGMSVILFQKRSVAFDEI
jgi:ABC-2 type transport system permease protein